VTMASSRDGEHTGHLLLLTLWRCSFLVTGNQSDLSKCETMKTSHLNLVLSSTFTPSTDWNLGQQTQDAHLGLELARQSRGLSSVLQPAQQTCSFEAMHAACWLMLMKTNLPLPHEQVQVKPHCRSKVKYQQFESKSPGWWTLEQPLSLLKPIL
jgi:hypothetical protein